MPGRLEFEVKFSTATQGRQRRSETSPMQILLMGDFSGLNATLPGFPIHRLDLDNFDSLIAKLSPRLALDIGTEQTQVVELEFKSLDDFHPDALFDRLPLFQYLRELRSQLNNPATFAQAAAQLALPTTKTETESAAEEAATAPSAEQSTDLLEELLGDRAAHIAAEPTAVKSRSAVDINTFIKNAIAPHIEAGPHPQRDSYIASVDLTISELMRSILHHPQFQALEAAWRSAYECTTRLELDESLRLYLLDASKEQLQQDLQQPSADFSASLVYQSVVEKSVQTLGGEPWSLIAGMYTFSQQSSDIDSLKALGQIAYHSGGPLIAAADPQILGCGSLVTQADARQWQGISGEEQQAWNELRDQPYANWLGLIFPRFLLRLPYGAKADEIERFEFEEMPAELPQVQRHERYLWGNAAAVCGVLIGQSYQHNGWSMGLGDVLEIDDLPWHVYQLQGEKTVQPCAEVVMSESSAEVIESYGIMPLMSYKNRNSVRLWRFRSLARQNAGLAGPWAD
jgi:type VI secretion system protein ImpC